MYCVKCGGRMPENGKCPVCDMLSGRTGFSRATDLSGDPATTPVRSNPPATAPVYPNMPPMAPVSVSIPAKQKKSKVWMIILIAAVLAVAAAVAGVLLSLYAGDTKDDEQQTTVTDFTEPGDASQPNASYTPEDTATTYFNACFTADAQIILDLLPRSVKPDLMADQPEAEFLEEKQKLLDGWVLMRTNMFYGKNWTYALRLQPTTALNRADYEKTWTYYKEQCGSEPEEMAIVTTEVDFSGSMNSETLYSTVFLVKLNGIWYVDWKNTPSLFG